MDSQSQVEVLQQMFLVLKEGFFEMKSVIEFNNNKASLTTRAQENQHAFGDFEGLLNDFEIALENCDTTNVSKVIDVIDEITMEAKLEHLSTVDFDYLMNEIDSNNTSPTHKNINKNNLNHNFENQNGYHASILQSFIRIPNKIRQQISKPVLFH